MTRYQKNNQRKKIVENMGKLNHIKPTENIGRLKLARDLVGILKTDRVDSYDSWYKLGLCLHNISRNLDIDPQLLDNGKRYLLIIKHRQSLC